MTCLWQVTSLWSILIIVLKNANLKLSIYKRIMKKKTEKNIDYKHWMKWQEHNMLLIHEIKKNKKKKN